MGTLLLLIIGAILTFGIFCFLCSNTRMVSFDGVNGFARGYLDLFIWSVLIAAGIIAGVWYIFGGIFSFIGSVFSAIFDFVFSEQFLGILSIPVCLYFLFGRSPNMKNRKKELDKSKCFAKKVITFQKDENGVSKQNLWYIDTNRIVNTENGLLVNAICITKDNADSRSLNEFCYRSLLFDKDENGNCGVGIAGPINDEDISMSAHKIKYYEDTKDNLSNIELMRKIAGKDENGKYKIGQKANILFKLNDKSEMDILYRFITGELGNCIK